ncbi:head scaffolding protein [Vibrio phage F86]
MSLTSEQKQIIDEQIQAHLKDGDTQSDVANIISVVTGGKELSEDETELYAYIMQQATLHLDEGVFEELDYELDEAELELAEEFQINEKLVKSVSVANRKAGGSLVTKKKDRATRKRRASQTTGLSKSKRQKTARKAAKTRKRQRGTSVERKAKKSRAKSMKKRKQMGL